MLWAKAALPGQGVGGETGLAADLVRAVEQSRVGHAAADAEGDQGHGMGMHDAANIRADAIDRRVEGKLGRRRMNSIDRPVPADADHVLAAETSLVNPRWRDPNVPAGLPDRKVPT